MNGSKNAIRINHLISCFFTFCSLPASEQKMYRMTVAVNSLINRNVKTGMFSLIISFVHTNERPHRIIAIIALGYFPTVLLLVVWFIVQFKFC